MPAKTASMESLKRFIRTKGANFLKRPGITSIGVGYKRQKGKVTNKICIQFTVARKNSLSELKSAKLEKLPKFLFIDGVRTPTDILQRTFARSVIPVDIEAKIKSAAIRKKAADPIRPGVSIGHWTISGGTLGCVVYDARSGAPYALSNWHVLCGSGGKHGDAVVQPGRVDDSHVEQNKVGYLERSHLGEAGDCAIATISERTLRPEIAGLDVAVKRIGDPELGDRVVKSGRTTGVTHGIVTRIYVNARFDIFGEGMTIIGGFEIGPDPRLPAPMGEISMGGDSGSAWLHTENDKPTDMMVGLHFAGEAEDEREYALACYASSVFEKLSILPHKPSKPVI